MANTTIDAVESSRVVDSASDAHGAHPFLAHHFDTPKHQFDAGKLGIWLFLVQEILFFSGLFCAYIIYRYLHPEIFRYGHYFLDTTWGAINTCVLLISSLTAAWAVRCAQLGNKRGLVINIVVTLICAFAFMGIKYVEYSHKFHVGLGPPYKENGQLHFAPTEHVWQTTTFQREQPALAKVAAEAFAAAEAQGPEAVAKFHQNPPPGLPSQPSNLHRFFAIYFCMTGLHGLHVIGGIAVWGWVLLRALRGEFGPEHFGAVDFSALYWHLVDLIWIFLFPLLYLID